MSDTRLRISQLPTTITAFRTGDVIAVDGPSGTAKMPKDSLLAITESNAWKGKNVQALGVTDLSTLTGGLYAIPLGYMSSITDLPDYTFTSSAYMIVALTNATPTYIQSIITIDGIAFRRVVSNGVAQTWKAEVDCVFNVNKYKNDTNAYTLAQALSAVPSISRRLGFIIAFRKAVGDERIYIYTAGSVVDANWNNPANWQEILFVSRIENNVQTMGVTSLATISDVGFYRIPSAYLASITDKPSGAPAMSCALRVEKLNDTAVVQFLTFGDFEKFIRIVNNGVAQAWYVDDVYHGPISSLGYTTFAQCSKEGFYWATSTDLSSITDKPSGLSGTSCCLRVSIANNSYLLQVLETLDGRVYRRRSTISSPYTSDSWVMDVGENSVQSLGITSLATIGSVGFYRIPTAYLPSLTDLPSDSPVMSCALRVEKLNDTAVVQFLTFGNLKKYVRVVVGGVAQTWYSDSISADNVQSMGITSLATISDVGFYQVPLAYMSSITDLPPYSPSVSASLFVEKANASAVIQTLTFTDLQSWSRVVSGGVSQGWYKNISPSVSTRTRFIAMGDSITEGYWAADDGTLQPPTSLNWPYYVGLINNWSVTNAGAGGSGYVHNGTVPPRNKNAVGMVNDVDFSNYDIVSFAWGVNDWHYECNIGDLSTSTLNDGTMVGNMRYCVEKVLTDNPKCKIVVILPFNSSMFGGDFDSNWGLGTSLPTSGTLQNVIDKIKSVCEYYGLQMIDSVNNSVVNRFNIEDYFPDGLHPAEDGYLQIARCYAKQMMFG